MYWMVNEEMPSVLGPMDEAGLWTFMVTKLVDTVDLATIDPRFTDAHRGDPNARVRVVVSIEGEDAQRLQRISAARGETPAELIAELLRDADRPAA